MDVLKYDRAHILKEHQEILHVIFETIDMDKVVFVGGIADYLNLRPKYQMPVNDIDLCFRAKEHIANFEKRFKMTRYPSLYMRDAKAVFNGECVVDGKSVHFDFFQQSSIYTRPISQSSLLGQKVLHTSFEGMQAFHNEHIELLCSDSLGEKYNWKRLYKHSRKAALYNMISFKMEREKNQIHEEIA